MTIRKRNRKNFYLDTQSKNDGYWMFGWHSCVSAIKNPKRRLFKLLVTEKSYELIDSKDIKKFNDVLIVSSKEIDTLLPVGSLHQGIAILTQSITQMSFHSLLLLWYHLH